MPVNTFLNCTMPELANISVGSLRGTSGEDATISWPWRLEEIEEGGTDLCKPCHVTPGNE